jgi:hypothetical protein
VLRRCCELRRLQGGAGRRSEVWTGARATCSQCALWRPAWAFLRPPSTSLSPGGSCPTSVSPMLFASSPLTWMPT